MAKSARTKASLTRSIPVAPGPDWVAATLALAGLALALFLLLVPRDAGLPGCPVGGGCDLVQRSRWSTFLGLPVTAYGALLYAAILLTAVRVKPVARLAWILLLGTIGLGISLYLSTVAWRELRVTCAYCLTSLALISTLTAYAGFRSRWRERLWLGALGCLLAGGVVITMHQQHGGLEHAFSGPEDPYLKDLALHLQASGARFFGASWCPHCQQQKALFGPAAKHLPYIECSPHGPQAPQATDCLAHDIKGYPTWIVNAKAYPKLLTVEQLAHLSGYQAPPAGP